MARCVAEAAAGIVGGPPPPHRRGPGDAFGPSELGCAQTVASPACRCYGRLYVGARSDACRHPLPNVSSLAIDRGTVVRKMLLGPARALCGGVATVPANYLGAPVTPPFQPLSRAASAPMPVTANVPISKEVARQNLFEAFAFLNIGQEDRERAVETIQEALEPSGIWHA